MASWSTPIYFREETPTDLDTTGQGRSVIDFIAKNFHRIRSSIFFACRHDHIYNICLLNNDSKPLQEILTPFLENYTCVINVNLSAGSIALQDNGKLRYITASIDNPPIQRICFAFAPHRLADRLTI